MNREELRLLAEAATPGLPALSDVEWIAAANPAAVLDLLDQLDAAEAERDTLAARLADTDDPHPDRPTCTRVGGKGIRVTVTDLETGESQSAVIENNYVLICAGDRYQSGIQYHANGTTVLTVKVRKHPSALRADPTTDGGWR